MPASAAAAPAFKRLHGACCRRQLLKAGGCLPSPSSPDSPPAQTALPPAAAACQRARHPGRQPIQRSIQRPLQHRSAWEQQWRSARGGRRDGSPAQQAAPAPGASGAQPDGLCGCLEARPVREGAGEAGLLPHCRLSAVPPLAASPPRQARAHPTPQPVAPLPCRASYYGTDGCGLRAAALCTGLDECAASNTCGGRCTNHAPPTRLPAAAPSRPQLEHPQGQLRLW